MKLLTLTTTALNPSGVFSVALSFSEPPTAAELLRDALVVCK